MSLNILNQLNSNMNSNITLINARFIKPLDVKMLNEIKKNHLQVFHALREKGIGVNLHYIPVHTQPFYKKIGFKIGDFPAAEQYYKEAISIPMFYGLQEEDQNYVISTLREVLDS